MLPPLSNAFYMENEIHTATPSNVLIHVYTNLLKLE